MNKNLSTWLFKKCIVCNNLFKYFHKRNTAKFCSIFCKNNYKTKYIYKCPICKKEKECTKSRFEWYTKNKSLCKTCHLKKMRQFIPPYTEERKFNRKLFFKKYNPSFKSKNKKKISQRMILNNPVKSQKTKDKIRLSVINFLENKFGKIYPYFNSNACQVIDEYGKKNGYNFQHALNGGEYHIKELGYWVDGYDKEKNVVIEFYEKSNKNKRKKIKDKIRKNKITKFLKCNFIELKEWEIN